MNNFVPKTLNINRAVHLLRSADFKRIQALLLNLFFILSNGFLSGANLQIFAQQTGDENPPVAKQNVEANKTEPPEKSKRPAFNIQREEEDWSFLADERNRTEPLDKIKYIPLGKKDGWFLSIGGEIRPYYEYFRNENWGLSNRRTSDYLLNRVMLHTDFRLGRRARFFFQLKSGLEWGRNNGARVPDEDKIDINQAFFDVNFSFAEKSAKNKTKLTVRLGRQEFNYGAGRMVSVREGPNVRQAFDGAKLKLEFREWKIDGFFAKPVRTGRGYFDDSTENSQSFWGVYATRPFPLIKKSAVDIYYLGVDRKTARFAQGAGREIRHSFGARLFNRGQNFDYDLEFVYQGGSFRNAAIRAWTVSTRTGYTFAGFKFRPRIGIDTGWASGDKNPLDDKLGTFSPPYPRGQYFGQIGANGPLNVRGFRPNATINPLKQVAVNLGAYFFWRDSLRDGLYGVPGVLITAGQNSRKRYIGWQPEIETVWTIDRHTTFFISYAKFYPGAFLRETTPGKNISYFSTKLVYKF